MDNLIVIDNLADFKALSEYLKAFDYVAYDIETTGVESTDEIIGFSVCAEADKAYYVILSAWDTATNKLIYLNTMEYAKEFISGLQSKQLLCHNAIFDCYMTESYFKVSLIESVHTDTMIMAHLINSDRRVGLKDLSWSMYGESSTKEQSEMKASVVANGGKLTKDCYELYKADPYLLGKYGAKDALLTYKLFLDLLPELDEQGLVDFFYKDESMPLLKGPTYDLNTTGLMLDQTKMTLLKQALVAECAAAKDFIYTEIRPHIAEKYPGTNKSNTFNIGAPAQLSWLIFGQLNLEFNTLTKEGKAVCKSLGLRLPYTRSAKRDFISTCQTAVGQVYAPEGTVNGKKVRAKKVKEPWSYIACDKKTLKKLSDKREWIKTLLEYQRKMKILSTYIEGMESRVRYGVMRPSFLQHGTKTGRYSSKNPNFQNLPREDQRVKECIVARPGKVFVSADYSQLEPRVFSYYSKDKDLMNAFSGETDFYSVIGIDMYGIVDAIPLKDGHPNAFGIKYPKYRQDSKTVALARAYGATIPQLARTLEKSDEETAEIIERYDERRPGVKAMMIEAHDLAKKDGYVTNLFGRRRWLLDAKKIPKLYGNQEHSDLPYDARQLLNAACNHRIQSTGGSIINRASIAFYRACKNAGIECKIICQVHDELIIECFEKDAEDVSLLLQHCMENTVILEGVPLEAVPRITKTMAK